MSFLSSPMLCPAGLTLAQVFAWVQAGQPAAQMLPADAGALALQRVHTDSRTVAAGDLFVALRGERFDAQQFLPQVAGAGAAAAVTGPGGLVASGLPGVEAPDTLMALGDIAAGWRRQWSDPAGAGAEGVCPLIAVTGSNGKTTVTQMLAAVLRAWQGEAALATQGNFNNEVGVPLTLLRLRPHHRVAVVELGMNHPGEIARLAAVAQPTVALVNNAQREHLEFMHSVQAVAQENGTVLAALPPQGWAVFPADDAYTPLWQQLAGHCRSMTFGAGGAVSVVRADWQAEGAWALQVQTPQGPLHTRLAIAGAHNVRNALAATACALAAGVPLSAIAHGLADFAPVAGRSRSQQRHFANAAHATLTLVDDSYNANPDSVRAAIEVLAGLPGPRLLVLGDMGEVGDQGPQLHAEVGAYAAQRGLEYVLALGTLSAHAIAAASAPQPGQQYQHYPDMASLKEAVLAALPGCASVLVKGSRFMRMEQVVQAIEEATCC